MSGDSFYFYEYKDNDDGPIGSEVTRTKTIKITNLTGKMTH